MKQPQIFSTIALVSVTAIVFTGSALSQSQSLGEVARQLRQNKPAEPAKKVITNDDLTPAATSPAIVAKPQTTEVSKSANAAGDTKPAVADKDTKLEQEWKDKLAAQKEEIGRLERELDVLQRENKLRTAVFYADAGMRLRDEKKYAADDRKYRDDIAAKQKDLDAAKAKLEDMKEEARKLGLPPRSSE